MPKAMSIAACLARVALGVCLKDRREQKELAQQESPESLAYKCSKEPPAGQVHEGQRETWRYELNARSRNSVL
jgi:hypothetical protein